MFPWIIQARIFVAYTASANDISINYSVIYVPQDTTVTMVDQAGNISAGVVLLAGYHPLNMRKITSISGGILYLCHNNDQPVAFEDLSSQYTGRSKYNN